MAQYAGKMWGKFEGIISVYSVYSVYFCILHMLQVVRCHHFATLSPPSTWPLGAALVSVFVSSTCFFEFLVANVGVIPGYPGLPELNFFAKHPLNPLGPWRLLAITGASP
jgi:hypothetical protein